MRGCCQTRWGVRKRTSTLKCLQLSNTWLRHTSCTLFIPYGWRVSLNKIADVPRKIKIKIDRERKENILIISICFCSHWGRHFSISQVVDFLSLLFSRFSGFSTHLSHFLSIVLFLPLIISIISLFCLFYSLICVESQTNINPITWPFNASK